jgi:hypothetical protein
MYFQLVIWDINCMGDACVKRVRKVKADFNINLPENENIFISFCIQ